MQNSVVAAMLLVVGVGGCGGSGLAGRMTAACVKDGEMTEEQCKCISNRAEKDLSKDAQALLVAELEENQAKVEELQKKLTMEDATQVGVFLMNAMGECTLGAAPQ